MDSQTIELGDKELNSDFLIGNVGDFDDSEIKQKKKKRIILIIITILLFAIIALILYFFLRCDSGSNEKCHSCKIFSKKCSSCNQNFRLENGKCVFIYSFEAIYRSYPSNDVNEETKLFNVEYLKDYEINKIQIDGKYVKSKNNYYKFSTENEHKVRVNIDLKNSSSLIIL